MSICTEHINNYHKLNCTGAQELQRRESDGVSLCLSPLCAVYAVFSASGRVLVPTHRHLPEIKTSWLRRVEQEEIETGGKGRVWGCRVKKTRGLRRKRGERKRDLPLSLFCSEFNSHTPVLNPLQLPHNRDTFT